jgi:hypothetical protein
MGCLEDQGDQIVRIFAYWAIAYYGQLFLITEVTVISGLFFPTLPVMYTYLNIDKLLIGIQSGRLFHKLIWSLCVKLRAAFLGHGQ